MYGYNVGVNDIKKHRYLNVLNLGNLLAKKISAPYKPTVKGEDDVSNFGTYEDSNKEPAEVPANKDPFLESL